MYRYTHLDSSFKQFESIFKILCKCSVNYHFKPSLEEKSPAHSPAEPRAPPRDQPREPSRIPEAIAEDTLQICFVCKHACNYYYYY